MRCPGVYPPDPTLGITDPQMLPPPKLVRAVATTSIGPVRAAASPAPGTGSSPAPCMTWATRWAGGPATSASPTPSTTAPGAAASSPPTCPTWPRPRPATPIGSWPWPSGLVVEDGLPYQAASWHLWRDHRVFVPFATIQNWVEAGGKKGGRSHRGRLPRLGPRRLLRVHRRRRVVRRPLLRPVDRRQPRLQAAVLRGPRPRPDSPGYPEVLPPLPGGPDRPRADPSRDHHRRFGALSAADLAGLRRREASGLPVPHPGGTEQGGPPRRRSGPQAPGGAEAEAPPRAPRHAGGETEGPAAPAPRSEDRGLVRASSSVREAPPHAG